MSKDLDYTLLRENFTEAEINTALNYVKNIADDFPPSYYTNREDFVPHAWVVAVALGLLVAAKGIMANLQEEIDGLVDAKGKTLQ